MMGDQTENAGGANRSVITRRNVCRLCDSSDLEIVVRLEPIPLAEKYVTIEQRGEHTDLYPVDLYMCRACGHVQLLDVIDPQVLWRDYTYESGRAQGMAEHFEDVAREIVRRKAPAPNALVVDVGSNDGTFLRCFLRRGFRVLGVDPATEIVRKANESGIATFAGFFTPQTAARLRRLHGVAEIITAFNAFAHTDDLHGMTEAIGEMLSPEGVFVFEAQYLGDVVERGLLGTIFHEHLSHHSIKPLHAFLARHRLELFDVARVPVQGGSIVGYVQPLGAGRPVSGAVAELVRFEERQRLDRIEGVRVFGERLAAAKAKMQRLLADWAREGKVVCGYGAARSGPTFINQFGLADSLQCIFDDHPAKVGKLSPGHHVPVVPTSEITVRRPDVIVVLAWVHTERIVRNNRAFLESGGTFVIFNPDVVVVDASTSPWTDERNA